MLTTLGNPFWRCFYRSCVIARLPFSKTNNSKSISEHIQRIIHLCKRRERERAKNIIISIGFPYPVCIFFLSRSNDRKSKRNCEKALTASGFMLCVRWRLPNLHQTDFDFRCRYGLTHVSPQQKKTKKKAAATGWVRRISWIHPCRQSTWRCNVRNISVVLQAVVCRRWNQR